MCIRDSPQATGRQPAWRSPPPLEANTEPNHPELGSAEGRAGAGVPGRRGLYTRSGAWQVWCRG
eukprot:8796858-Alexandrium_andersonii.AAC.1